MDRKITEWQEKNPKREVVSQSMVLEKSIVILQPIWKEVIIFFPGVCLCFVRLLPENEAIFSACYFIIGSFCLYNCP